MLTNMNREERRGFDRRFQLILTCRKALKTFVANIEKITWPEDLVSSGAPVLGGFPPNQNFHGGHRRQDLCQIDPDLGDFKLLRC